MYNNWYNAYSLVILPPPPYKYNFIFFTWLKLHFFVEYISLRQESTQKKLHRRSRIVLKFLLANLRTGSSRFPSTPPLLSPSLCTIVQQRGVFSITRLFACQRAPRILGATLIDVSLRSGDEALPWNLSLSSSGRFSRHVRRFSRQNRPQLSLIPDIRPLL